MEIRVSRTFLTRLKLSEIPQYKIAWRAGMHPTALSQLINGARKVKQGDPRIVKAGKLLGLKPDECFESIAKKDEYKDGNGTPPKANF